MWRSLATGRNALINLFIAAVVIFIAFNAIRGGNDRDVPVHLAQRDTSNELRLTKAISASEYVEIDGQPYLLLMAKSDNERIETADLRIISADPNEPVDQAGWIHTSMSVQRPPEALTYAMGHVYVGLARQGVERPALWVVDMSNPRRPYEANLMHAPFPIRSLAASDDGFMVASGFEDELLIYDISQPNEPEVSGSFQAPVSMPPEIYLDGSTLMVEHGAGLLFYDMSKPDSPELVFEHVHPNWQEPPFTPTPVDFLTGNEGFESAIPARTYLDLSIGDELLALASSADGFSVLDPVSGNGLANHSLLEIDGRVVSVAIDGDSLFVLSGRLQRAPQVRFTVTEVDISDPRKPVVNEDSRTITGLPRYQRVIARDGSVWILFNHTVMRFRSPIN